MFRFATSELLSTFFPTWLWQGKQWLKGKVPSYDPYYWGNAHAHPVLSTYYPPAIALSYISSLVKIDTAFHCLVSSLFLHYCLAFCGWFILIRNFSGNWCIDAFGAFTITFGAYALKQQPCIIYTLAWFPLTLYQDPVLSALALGMMLLAGYYPFSIYLIPISVVAHILWYSEAWLLMGIIIGLPQIVPFLCHLPKTIKRLDDKCQSPEVERRFYVGVIPILLLPFSTSRIWPITLLSCLFSLGLFKSFFPRVHERWLIVIQFGIGWMSVSALNNLNLNHQTLYLLVVLHAFDIFWHNRECLPPTPYYELWQKPSRVFNSKLTRFLESNLGDYKVSGLPHPIFTGHINEIKTIGYCGSMQTNKMWSWRKSYRHDPFIDGVAQHDLNKYRIKYAFSYKRPSKWSKTIIRHLYRNPEL